MLFFCDSIMKVIWDFCSKHFCIDNIIVFYHLVCKFWCVNNTILCMHFTLKVMKQPWPGMARTIFGDHERFERVYFSKFNGYYTTGDGELLIKRHAACCYQSKQKKFHTKIPHQITSRIDGINVSYTFTFYVSFNVVVNKQLPERVCIVKLYWVRIKDCCYWII